MAGADTQCSSEDNWDPFAAELKLFCDSNLSDCEVILQSQNALGREG